MTVKECELRNRLAMLGAINWAKGEDDSEITYWSVVLMCECLDIKCPDYMVKFVSSENVNRFPQSICEHLKQCCINNGGWNPIRADIKAV